MTNKEKRDMGLNAALGAMGGLSLYFTNLAMERAQYISSSPYLAAAAAVGTFMAGLGAMQLVDKHITKKDFLVSMVSGVAAFTLSVASPFNLRSQPKAEQGIIHSGERGVDLEKSQSSAPERKMHR